MLESLVDTYSRSMLDQPSRSYDKVLCHPLRRDQTVTLGLAKNLHSLQLVHFVYVLCLPFLESTVFAFCVPPWRAQSLLDRSQIRMAWSHVYVIRMIGANSCDEQLLRDALQTFAPNEIQS